jgi:hypothetical protein
MNFEEGTVQPTWMSKDKRLSAFKGRIAPKK